MTEAYHWDTRSEHPDLMLITNHGYAGVEIPVGGAPDTGGQNFYVNSLSLALERLGYRVTIVARGGFPFFDSDRMRDEPELLSEHVRYLYVPGGGDQFIRKEDIAIALDEEVQWLDAYIRQEAQARGCRPWEVYELVNTHYWDAAVMGMRLVERWKNDVAYDVLEQACGDEIDAGELAEVWRQRHWLALGEQLSYHLGRLMLDQAGPASMSAEERAGRAMAAWAPRWGSDPDAAAQTIRAAVRDRVEGAAPPLHPLRACPVLGQRVLGRLELTEVLERRLQAVDRHVWTPHSLGDLKAENYRDKPASEIRHLKFCERRDHERAVCDRTRYFAATSEEIAERLHTHLGVELPRIFYFPPCVDQSVFRRYSEQELAPTYAYLSEESGVPVQTLRSSRIVFETSRMDRTKRKDLLLEAFAKVAPEFDDVYLFIGGGPARSEIFEDLQQQRQADPVLRERAFLLGFIPDEHLAPMFGVADIFASASEMEGFGMSASQAAGAGVAVVLSDLIPFALQYVPDDAIVFPAGDAEAMAAGIRELLADDEARRQRAERLAERTKVLDWDVQADEFLRYLRVAGLAVATGAAA
jgi:glycosyltransferase involved in cell wall biosynthesis